MASIGQSSQLVSKWHDAIQNDCNALEQRTSLDPADEQDAASGAALSMASASSQSRPARRPRTAPSRAPAASRAQNIAAIKSKTQKLFGARHKRLPMVPRGCQGVATTLAFLSEEKGDPVELEYVLAGRVRCKERSFRQDHALQDLDNVLVSKAMPFVTIVSTEGECRSSLSGRDGLSAAKARLPKNVSTAADERALYARRCAKEGATRFFPTRVLSRGRKCVAARS